MQEEVAIVSPTEKKSPADHLTTPERLANFVSDQVASPLLSISAATILLRESTPGDGERAIEVIEESVATISETLLAIREVQKAPASATDGRESSNAGRPAGQDVAARTFNGRLYLSIRTSCEGATEEALRAAIIAAGFDDVELDVHYVETDPVAAERDRVLCTPTLIVQGRGGTLRVSGDFRSGDLTKLLVA